MTYISMLQHQEQAGGILADAETGSPRVVHFGNPADEYRAACDDAAVFDLSDRTQIELTGGDRHKFLHNFCTNNINTLQPGQGCEGFVTSVKGRILGHVFVFAAPDSLWVETVPQAAESLLPHLERYIITEDVQLHDRTAEFGELLVSGPQSNEKLERIGISVSELPVCGHAMSQVADTTIVIHRVDWLGQSGLLLSVSQECLGDVWKLLTAADIRPAGSEAFESLRIEAGFPLFGIDISSDNLAQEAARTSQAISFTKGCYLGQEPIARIDALGHVNQELRGLKIVADVVPAPGSTVIAADGEKEIGVLSSTAFGFGDDQPVGLAMLRRAHINVGTDVLVKIGDTTAPAVVFWPE